MNRLFSSVAVLALATPALAQQCPLIAAAPAVAQSGFKYTEGPAWSSSGFWVFSDIPANTVYKFDGSAAPVAFRQPSGFANGNAFDSAGNLWSAQHDRKLTKTEPTGRTEVVVASFKGKSINSPNDLVIAADGSVWFSDPSFGISGYGPEKAPEEQPVRGIYRVKNGAVSLMNGELKQPNGLAFSPDGRFLYVADTFDGIYRFAVSRDGQLIEKIRFAALEPLVGQSPNADGLKVDASGHVWLAGPKALGVFDTTGKQLCRIPIEAEHVANLAFGGQDGKSVLVTASDKIYTFRLR